MKIKINEDYYMVQQGNHFDLYWNKPTQKVIIGKSGTGARTRQTTDEKTRVETIMGYSMNLEKCLKVVINNELEKQDKEVDLKEWLEMYKKEMQKFSELFKQFNNK